MFCLRQVSLGSGTLRSGFVVWSMNAVSIPLSPSQVRDYKHTPPLSDFSVGVGDETLVLMLV